MPKAKYKKHEATGKYIYWFNTGEYKENGKPKYKALYADTQPEMDAKIKEATLKKNQGVSLNDDKITVAQWAETWLNDYNKGNVRQNTFNSYKNTIYKHIIPNIGSYRLRDIREHHLQLFLTNMGNSSYNRKIKVDDNGEPILDENGEEIVLNEGKPYSEKSVKEVRSVLYMMFKKAQRNQLIPINPADELKVCGIPKKERRALTDYERKKVLEVCGEDNIFSLFVLIMYYCGLRKGEVTALTTADIKNNFIDVNKQITYPNGTVPVIGPPKSDAGYREVPIPKQLNKRLKIRLNELEGIVPLFPGKEYSYPKKSKITTNWENFEKKVLDRRTIKEITPDEHITEHMLRHNYCTMLYENGIDVLTAAKYMGHDNPETTIKIYTHLRDEQKKKSDSIILNFEDSLNPESTKNA